MEIKNKEILKASISKFLKSDRAILMICIGIALIMWFLVKLDNEFSTKVTYPVVFEIPPGRTFTNKAPTELNCSISSQGWNLISISRKSKTKAIKIKLKDIDEQSLSEGFIIRKIRQLLPPKDYKISNLSSQGWDISLNKIANKKVPIRVLTKISCKNGYHFNKDFKLSQDSAFISGAIENIEEIEYWNTELIKKNNLAKSIVGYNTLLEKPQNENITILPKEILVDIEIEAFSEKTITIPISNISKNQIAVPNTVQVVFNADLERYHYINASSFKISIEKKGTLPKTSSRALTIVEKPENVNYIRLIPPTINLFTIED